LLRTGGQQMVIWGNSHHVPRKQLGSPWSPEKGPFWLPVRKGDCSSELPIQAQMEKGSTRV